MYTKRYHIIIDVSSIQNKILTGTKELEKFLKILPKVIGMSVLSGPVIAQGIEENPGISGFVIIDYSHISIHTFSKYREALVDIFSCKKYKKSDAVKAVLKFFQVPKSQANVQEVSWG